jgi:hypothetical protein
MPGRKGAKRRTPEEVEAVREAAREELEANYPMALRQVHYRLVSRDDIVHPNTRSAYQKLSEWLRDDRLAGDIPWEYMEDRLRVAKGWAGWDEPGEWVEDELEGYYRDPWQDDAQDHYVEVWVEKDALSGIFSAALGRYRVTYNIGRGYDGWTSIKRAAERYRWQLDWHGRETTVLYFGDFDPSGEDMVHSLTERLAQLGAEPELVKVALTREDARRLPGDVTKADDSRAAAFVAKYGDLAVELDALPVAELRQRIRDSVEEHMNLDALAESSRLERLQRERIAEVRPEPAEMLRARMADVS